MHDVIALSAFMVHFQVTKLDSASHSNKFDEKGSTKSILDFVKKMDQTSSTSARSSAKGKTRAVQLLEITNNTLYMQCCYAHHKALCKDIVVLF